MEIHIFLSLFSFYLSTSSAFYFHVAEREEKCIIEDIPNDTWITGVQNKMYFARSFEKDRFIKVTQRKNYFCNFMAPIVAGSGMFTYYHLVAAISIASWKGNYKVEQWDINRQDFLDSAPGLGMFVTVTTYNDEVLLSRLYGPRGTFTFTSHSPGEHIICLESNSTKLISFGGSKLRIHLDIRIGEHDLDAVIAQAKDKVNEVSYKLEHLTEQIEQIIKEQNYQREREENFRMTSEDTNSNVLWWALVQILILISIGIFQMKSLKDFFIAKKLV